jgi:uncharacterized membrane protein YqiK
MLFLLLQFVLVPAPSKIVVQTVVVPVVVLALVLIIVLPLVVSRVYKPSLQTS